MANLYKRYMKLLDKWPLDKSKSPDLGQHIRDQIKIQFSKGEKTKIADEKQCLKNIESLERLASNYYGNKYAVPIKRSATGLSPEVCNAALSQEFQEILKEQKDGFIPKLKRTFEKYFSKDK